MLALVSYNFEIYKVERVKHTHENVIYLPGHVFILNRTAEQWLTCNQNIVLGKAFGIKLKMISASV